MAYNDSVKLRAYNLFLQSLSYEAIAETIRREFNLNKLSPTTVRNWAEKADAGGGTWIEYRQNVRALMRRNVNEANAGRAAEIQSKAETIQQALFDRITSEEAPKVSSMEGGAYAFKTISEFILALDKKNGSDMSPLLVVQAMLEIFKEIPDVRRAIEKHWKYIRDRIDGRMNGDSAAVIEVKKISDE